MSRESKGRIPKTQPAASGGPPRPPKKTARELADDSPGDSYIHIPDPVTLRDLAVALGQKPFIIVGDAMKLGLFATVRDSLAFEVAEKIAKVHGFDAHKVA